MHRYNRGAQKGVGAVSIRQEGVLVGPFARSRTRQQHRVVTAMN